MRGWDLGVGDALVLADLLGDGGAELGRGDDVVEVVDLHDGGDGAARLPEEVEHAVPRLLQRRRVRRHLHRAHRERHLSLSLSFSPPANRPLAPRSRRRLLRRRSPVAPIGGGGFELGEREKGIGILSRPCCQSPAVGLPRDSGFGR